MSEIHATRRRHLLGETESLDVDALLLTSLVNVRYLTGFTGSNAALLLLRNVAVLATDGRYTTQVGEEVPDVDVLIDRQLTGALLRRASEARTARLAFEEYDVTVASHDALLAAADGIELTRMGRPVEALRAVKDDSELVLLTKACEIGDAAFAAVLADELRPGRTEREIAHALAEQMRVRGADGPSFETIVAAGPNSAIPHHQPTDRVIERGDFVKCDFGALVEGYHSDMTRTVVVGQAADWQREVYAVVSSAAQAGRDAVVPGAACRDVDARARSVVENSAFAGRFVHGLGHGVGLEIHERPTLAVTTTDTLAERMPVTIEPGVYLPGRGGVRIEDIVVVRPDGAQPLTTTTRELLEI